MTPLNGNAHQLYTIFCLGHQHPTSGLQCHHMGHQCPCPYMKLAFTNDHHQAKAPTPWLAFIDDEEDHIEALMTLS